MELIAENVEKTPLRLRLVAGLIFVTGLFVVVLAVLSILFKNPVYSKYTYMMAIGGIIDIILAFGLLKGEKTAWLITVAIETIYLVLALWVHRWLAVAVSALILAALLTSSNYFGICLLGKFKEKSKAKSATPASVVVYNSKYFRRVKP